MDRIVDPVTGEIDPGPPDWTSLELPAEGTPVAEIISHTEHPSFASLDDAEEALYDLEGQGESLRIQQIRVLNAIREQQLYRERENPKTGQPFASMEDYVPYLIKSLGAWSQTAPRTLKSWVSRYRIFVEQLGWDHQDLLDMGAHTELLLPLAARSAKTLALSPEDEPQDNGGRKLGRAEFERVSDDIKARVEKSLANPSVPELRWTTADTKQVVQEILGTTKEKVNFQFDCSWRGDKVVIESISIWVGEDDDAEQYRIGDVIQKSLFERVAGSAKVVGLGDNWRDG